MNDSYVDAKVREVILAAKGSRTVAQQMLMAAAAKDERLLLGMAQPFLKAIAAAAIERVGRAASAPRAQPGTGSLSREALERVLSRMGEEPAPGAPSAAAPPAGQRAAAPARAAQAAPDGVDHQKSMMAIAKAFAAKKIG